jgi:hypothetical protein
MAVQPSNSTRQVSHTLNSLTLLALLHIKVKMINTKMVVSSRTKVEIKSHHKLTSAHTWVTMGLIQTGLDAYIPPHKVRSNTLTIRRPWPAHLFEEVWETQWLKILSRGLRNSMVKNKNTSHHIKILSRGLRNTMVKTNLLLCGRVCHNYLLNTHLFEANNSTKPFSFFLTVSHF